MIRRSSTPDVLQTSLSIYHPLIITHEHETRFASKCKGDKLLTKPVYKKKTFLARAFTTRGIEIWNNLSVETKHIVMKGAFKSALRRQLA